MAKRYQPQALLSEQDGVQTFSGRDALTGLPVLLYSFMGEPTSRPGELTSLYIPPVLEVTHIGGAGEVVTAFSPEFQVLRGTVPSQQVEALLRHTAAALDDAARAGVVHGDLSSARVRFDSEAGGRFMLEGYGVPWRVRPSEFSPPERISGATFAGDLFSWAMTVRHLSGPLPGDLRDLLSRCLDADPQARPHAREVRAELERYAFSPRYTANKPQAARDESPFERFATSESQVEQTQADEDDLTPPESSGWHMPLPPVITDRITGTPDEGDTSVPVGGRAENDPTETAPAPRPLETPAEPLSLSGMQLEPIPKPTIQETDLPPESLRRTDGTLAYEAKRKQYQAGQNGGEGTAPKPAPKRQQREVRPVAGVARPLEPVTATPSAEARSAVDEAPLAPPSSEVPSPSSPKGRARREGQRRAVGPDDLEPVTPPELGEAFEVEDDIDDRVPFGSGAHGGPRVLLSTLLVIAIVVLLALQFI